MYYNKFFDDIIEKIILDERRLFLKFFFPEEAKALEKSGSNLKKKFYPKAFLPQNSLNNFSKKMSKESKLTGGGNSNNYTEKNVLASEAPRFFTKVLIIGQVSELAVELIPVELLLDLQPY